MIPLSWLTASSSVDVVLIASAIIMTAFVVVVMVSRVVARWGDPERDEPGLFDPVLFVSSLTVIGLAVITYLVR